MQSRNHFVSEHYDEHTSILFVDGMGIEYVDYLAHLFSDLDEQQYSVFFDAGFCTLPSVTEINKDFMNGRNTVEPVSYTHLDVYKRQSGDRAGIFAYQLLSILDYPQFCWTTYPG